MVAATPSLPEISTHESELLAHFLILRYDFVALAEHRKLLPEQLLAFAQSPAVNAHLAALKSFAETAFSLRHLEARVKSLDILEKIATTSENPIEQRRAASTIFRGIGLQRDRQSPSEPSGASRRPLNSGLGTRTSTLAPTPRATPSPSLPAEVVIKELTQALADRPNPDAAATLQSFLSPNATINNQPVSPDTLEQSLARHIPNTEVVQTDIADNHDQTPGPPEAFTTHIYLIHNGGRQIRIKTTLTRSPAGWLLSALHIGPNTS
jgi:hypothetical protein